MKKSNARHICQQAPLTFLLFLLFLGQQLKAQVSITPNTTVPITSLNVGSNGSELFSTIITNSDTIPVDIKSITLKLPLGISIVQGSILLNGETVPDSLISGNLISNECILLPSNTLNIQYSVVAGCLAIPTDLGNSFSVKESNEMDIDYTYNRNDGNGIQIGEKSNISGNYSVTFPYVSVTTKSQVDRPVQFLQQFNEKDVEVTNSSTAGSANSMIFIMAYSNTTAIDTPTFNIVGPSATVAVPNSIVTINSGVASFPIDINLLTQIGLGNSFDAGKTFTIQPSFTPLIYFSQLQATYSIQVIADTTCNPQKNASVIINYTQIQPTLTASIRKTNVTLANLCGQPYTATYTITNTSPSGNSNYLLGLQYGITSVKNVTLSAVNGKAIPLDSQGALISIPTNDNFDQTGNYNDLAPGDSVSITVTIAPDTTNGGAFDYEGVDVFSYTNIENINGTPLTDYSSSIITVSTMLVNPPTDMNEGDTQPFTFGYSSFSFNLDPSDAVLNITAIYAVCDATGEKISIPLNNGNVVAGTVTFNVTGECGVPLIFHLEAETTLGCTLRNVSTTTASTFIHCKNKPGSGGCFTMSTNSVTLSQSAINTCETVDLASTGTLVRATCSDTCPQFSTIVCFIHDLNGTNVFSGHIANTTSTISLTIDGKTYSTGDYSLTNNGIQWAIPVTLSSCDSINQSTDNFTFNIDNLLVGYDHSLPNPTEMNLRVDFYPKDANGNIYTNVNEWGANLTVYDPTPGFASYSYYPQGCGTSANTVVNETAQKPGDQYASNPMIIINRIKFPSLSQEYYPASNSMALDSSYTEDIDSLDGQVFANNGVTTFLQSAVFLCGVDQSPFYVGEEDIYYTDFLNTACQNQFVKTFPAKTVYVASLPNIVLNSSTEQNLGSTTSWTLDITNYGHSTPSSVILKIQPDSRNMELLTIMQLTLNGVILTPSEYQTVGNTIYVNVGSIGSQYQHYSSNKQAELIITASATNCYSDGNSILDVYGAWSCTDLSQTQDLASNFAIYNCGNTNAQLQMQNMVAVLQAVETNQTQSYNLCQNIPVSVTISNSGRADLSNLGFWFDPLSNGESLVNNEITASFKGVTQNIVDGIAPSNLIIPNNNLNSTLPFNTILSQYVLNNDSINPALSTLQSADSINLNFNIKVNCSNVSVTAVNPITFHSTALSNCGNFQEHDFVFYPPITGFGQLQQMRINASATDFNLNGNLSTSSLNVSLTNNSATSLNGASVTVALPLGVINTTTNANGFTIKTTNTDSTQSVQLTSTAGDIPSGQQVNFILNLQDSLPCHNLGTTAQVIGSITHLITNCDSTTCYFKENTVPISVKLNRVQGLTLQITDSSTVCSGTSTILTASGANSYAWSNADTTSSITVTPVNITTYTVTATSDGCIGTASTTVRVNFACCAIGKLQGADTVCAGDTLTKYMYTVTGANMPVTWSLINPWMNVLTPSGNSVSLQFKYGQSQSLQLVATAGLGCSDTLHILSLPTPTVINGISDTITLCRLTQISYGLTVTPDVWPIHLQFYNSTGDTLTNTVLPAPSSGNEMYGLPTIDSSSFTQKYYIRLNDNHCFSYLDSLLVLRHAAPDAWFVTSSSCAGDTVTMKLYARDLHNCGVTEYGLNLKYNTDSLTYVSYSMANSIATQYSSVGVTTIHRTSCGMQCPT